MKSARLRRWPGLILALTAVLATNAAEARALRLFVIGNSFSRNATHYLPDLAASGGHELVLKLAQVGGCSLEKHANALAAALKDPADQRGKIYAGHSLPELFSADRWDVVTIQQFSLLSGDPATYRPYADQLRAFLNATQPQAQLMIHQTWAYRSDAPEFCQLAPGVRAGSAREMWTASRAAYRKLAGDLGAALLPVGDAFWAVDSDPRWAFLPEPHAAAPAPVYPALPPQPHTLHVGYHWNDGKFGNDTHHAGVAGEYLAALVWYGVLFAESPERVAFAPPELPTDFAAHLRRVAAEVVTATRTDQCPPRAREARR